MDLLTPTLQERLAISALAQASEEVCVQKALEAAKPFERVHPVIENEARRLCEALKEKQAHNWLEAFLHEYGLESEEGIAVMCLAEALLRIPDAKTADRLIESSFKSGDWEEHLGKSDSWFVNASSWGLLLASKTVRLNASANRLGKLVEKLGDVGMRASLKTAMRFIGTQFVLGQDIVEAMKNAKVFEQAGYRMSYDILGEGARSESQAHYYMQAYAEAIALLAEEKRPQLFEGPGISIKLSALYPRYQFTQAQGVMEVLLPRIRQIAHHARNTGIAIAIDAEEASRFDIQLAVYTALSEDKDLRGWDGLGFVLQAYQKRALATVDYLAAMARKQKRRIPVRLVKGAYWDSEIKLAQLQGLPDYPVFTRKEHTDVSYLACAVKLLDNLGLFYPQFATHNARSVASIAALAKKNGIHADQYEFQRLHGMGEALHDKIVPVYRSRIYAPVGTHKDLLAYLIRRLLENGANTSFVNLLMDQDVPMSQLIADPIAKAKLTAGKPHPHIPLPERIYSDRKNSEGFDLSNLHAVTKLNTSLNKAGTAQFPPVHTREWARAEVRIKVVQDLADILEEMREEWIRLLTSEAGKTVADSIAEVREAADFCRYYALQARRLLVTQALQGPTGESNSLSLHPRGSFVCISPWNFPLAIFTGQIAAALVTGNKVIAKPAEQTPLIAKRAVEIMYAAGVPKDMLELVLGDGQVGAQLVAGEHDGVVFTGSHETALNINRALALKPGPIVPLIAETGGINCMVVDSSALLEQAVDDIVTSAFGSAGQRCSALRLLYVQDDIADVLLELLAGAMQELRLGNPADLSTDIGPVIDSEAQAMLNEHIAGMKKTARLVAATPLPTRLGNAKSFIAPHVFELKRASQLDREIFGPVLHVVRFSSSTGERARVVKEINAKGFGLTFGIHSRVQGNIEFFTSRIRAGNIYVNRSMIGATVGVQPFGGEGLSGTGPKAGGPHYLLRFLLERTKTINTAAIGGNFELLIGQTATGQGL